MHRLCHTGFAALVAVTISSAPAVCVTVGQPFLVASGADAKGFILDFFDDETGGPSGFKNVSASGTITQAFGAPSLVGSQLAFNTSGQGPSPEATLTVAGTTIDDFAIFPSNSGSYDYDPFQPGPGDLNFRFFIIPPHEEDPIGTFVYGDAFAEYPSRVAEFPEFEVLLSIFLDGPLPTNLHEIRDSETNEIIESFRYIEGDLPVSRITLGTVIPLPAGLPLLAVALGMLALAGYRRR